MPLHRRRTGALRADRHIPADFSSRGSSLGLAALTTDDLIRAVQRGFSFRSLELFASETGFPPAEIASIVGIPERTFARRKSSGRLSPDESERLLRVSSIFEKAAALFEGDVPETITWLTHPKKALGDKVPLSYARSELGAREVENLIGRMEHGVFT
ncbi:MAG TPA: antitoxin Xre-like helix-turn-helix domain-containing protein [Candidatus Limnocylindrales bacterium]|nr:antitoxin Xre-like helix-turn-helix domain-containing protein [Candidatus Limnocylindrales bacterium]